MLSHGPVRIVLYAISLAIRTCPALHKKFLYEVARRTLLQDIINKYKNYNSMMFHRSMRPDKVKPMLMTHGSEFIYVFTDGRIFFTDKKMNGHDVYTQLLWYNVYGYTAYAKVDDNDRDLPLNSTLFQCDLVDDKKITTPGTILLVKMNVFVPIQ